MAAKKDLASLIRIRKWDVDEKQRMVGALMRREEMILNAKTALAEEIQNEMAFVSDAAPTQRFTFTPYLKRCEGRKAEIEAALVEARRMIDEARDELAESYRQLKTFEVTEDAREAAETAEENRLEQMELDEIGLTLHRRRAAP